MKKSFFSCFHPLVLETQTDQINVDHNKKGLEISRQRNNSKRPLSHVLEILLPDASLKIKVSDRNVRQLLLQPKSAMLRRISRHLQLSGDDKTRRDKRVKEAKFSQTEIRSSVPSPSLYESKNKRASTVGSSFHREESRDGSHEVRLITKPCSCKINPGLYLCVATLFFTVVWGRVGAVLFALVFLYLLPVWACFLR